MSADERAGLPQSIPVPEQLPPSLSYRVGGLRAELEGLGFAFKEGAGAMALESVPGGYDYRTGGDPLDLLRAAVAALEDGRPPEFVLSGIPGASCKAAVKITDRLSPEEAEALLEYLFRCGEPALCPHGRPTFIRLREGDLARLFARSGK